MMGLNKRDPATGWNPLLTGIADRASQNGAMDRGGFGGLFVRGITQGWRDKGLIPPSPTYGGGGSQPAGPETASRVGYGASRQEEAAPQQIDPRLVQLMAARAQRGRFGRF